jgi:hypothetical protein
MHHQSLDHPRLINLLKALISGDNLNIMVFGKIDKLKSDPYSSAPVMVFVEVTALLPDHVHRFVYFRERARVDDGDKVVLAEDMEPSEEGGRQTGRRREVRPRRALCLIIWLDLRPL